MGDYATTAWLLQRALAFVYCIGFINIMMQWRALLGQHGLTPVQAYVKGRNFRSNPSLFIWRCDDQFIQAIARVGFVLSLGALLGITEQFGFAVSMTAWFLLWALYLSFVNVGQVWYGFGWESILLECGFLAIFIGPANAACPWIIIWLYRWVLFRVMFGAGLIKWRGDSCWRDLTAMHYHYETQPIPGPLSWYFHRLPGSVNQFCVAATFFVELVIPWGYFIPGPIGYVCGAITVWFMVMLILSGNLSWLNYLTLVLCIACFDDSVFGASSAATTYTAHEVIAWLLALFVAVRSWGPIRNMWSRRQVMNTAFDPLHLVNTYGAFGSITRQRYEIVIEGCADTHLTPDSVWQEYHFKGKPTALNQRPRQIAPYHLRLDWLMWFAAMGPHGRYPWFMRLIEKLLLADPQLLGLLAANPFPDAPPCWVRAQYYRYRFTDGGAKDWWERELMGSYLPPLKLQ